MPSPPPEVIVIARENLVEVTARMTALASTRDGWINLEPEVAEEAQDAVTAPGLFDLLAARGPQVPLCTWSPGERPRSGRAGARAAPSIGIQHQAGPRAASRLGEAGHAVPEGWVVTQDHPRRGLVVRVPEEAAPAAVLEWLLGAGEALCPLPVSGRWRAVFFTTRRG